MLGAPYWPSRRPGVRTIGMRFEVLAFGVLGFRLSGVGRYGILDMNGWTCFGMVLRHIFRSNPISSI